MPLPKTSAALFRRRLKQAREHQAISIRELARRAGVSNALLSQLEGGQTENPTLCTLYGLAKALEVKVGWLVGEGE